MLFSPLFQGRGAQRGISCCLCALRSPKSKSARIDAPGCSSGGKDVLNKVKTTRNANKRHKTGLHKEYFRDGQLSSVGKYLNGKRTGLWKYYLRNGKLKAIGEFSDGQFTGLWKWYRENGKLLQIGRFENGKQVGPWKRYHATGRLYDAGKYVDGKKSGDWKIYDRSGKLVRTKSFG